jgi:DNA polymerase III subunit delta'
VLFKDIIGHRELKASLRERIRKGMMPHATLFAGPEGSGTFQLALACARYMNCEARTEDDACGTCNKCGKYNTWQHADTFFSYPVIRVNDETNSADFIEQWREMVKADAYFTLDQWKQRITDTKQIQIFVSEVPVITKNLSLKAYEGGPKVQIMWMLEMMNEKAANKILKILEEPPSDSFFMMTAQSADSILPTILSRVQLVKVPALSDEQIAEALQERHGCDAKRAMDIAYLADGDYAKAAQIFSSTDDQTAFLTQFKNWMRACYKRDGKAIGDLSAIVSKYSRDAQRQLYDYALHFTRQCIVFNYGQVELARFTAEEQSFAENFAPFIHHNNVVAISELFNAASQDVGRNVNARIVFVDLSLKLHRQLHRKH